MELLSYVNCEGRIFVEDILFFLSNQIKLNQYSKFVSMDPIAFKLYIGL